MEGWGIDAGVSFNLPTFGAGDKFLVTGTCTENAAWYSGLPDAMFGELGAVSGNGQQMAIADTYENPDGQQLCETRIWSVSAEIDHHFSPQFVGSLEGSYGQVRWTERRTSEFDRLQQQHLARRRGRPLVSGRRISISSLKRSIWKARPKRRMALSAGAPGSGFNTNFQGRGDGFESRFEITRNW